MKKFIMFFFIISLSMLIFGCDFNIAYIEPKETGKEPTIDFTYNDYFADNMILPQKKNFTICGTSEEGVLLKAILYDDKGYVVQQSYDFAEVDGKYSITIAAPKGGFTKYQLIISDSVHEHKFNNILFGEVILYAGEKTILPPLNNDIDPDEEVETNKNIKFLKYLSGKYSWVDSNDKNLYCVTVDLANKLYESLKMPVAIIDGTLSKVHADAWLSRDSVLNRQAIIKYLDYICRPIGDEELIPLNQDAVSAMYNTYNKILSDIKISCIIWSQGQSDFKSIDEKDYYNVSSAYCYLLSLIFSELTLNNKDCLIYSIQEPFNDASYANTLRLAQAAATYQLNSMNIIPTYDLYDKVLVENPDESKQLELKVATEEIETESEEDIEEEYNYIFSYDKYIERIKKVIINTSYELKKQYLPASYSNVVATSEVITLTFTSQLKDNIEEIDGLFLIDEEGNEIEYTFDIDRNHLYIYPVIEEDVELSNYTISYGLNEDIYICNLLSSNDMPVLPFVININE